MFRTRPGLRRGTAALAVAAFVTVSCDGEPIPKHDRADACAYHRGPFERIAQEWNRQIAQWAAAGALAGALSVLRRKKSSVERVLAHALIGGAAGALIGYLQNLHRRARTQEELKEALASDSRSRYASIEQLKRALRDLGRCRARQLEALKADVQAGRISREVARARLEQIRTWITADRELINKTTGLTEKQTQILLGAHSNVTRQPVGQLIREWQSYRPEVSAAPAGIGSVRYATAGVRMRAGPGTGYGILTVIPRGTAVRVLAERGGWTEIEYTGQRGYVASRYLSDRRPGRAPARTVERSREERDPVRKVAYAQKELEVEKQATMQELSRKLSEVDLLLRTQAWWRIEQVRVKASL